MKKIETIGKIIFVLILIWIFVSYGNILANNTHLDGTPSKFANWNFFTMFL